MAGFMDWLKHSFERSISVYTIGLAIAAVVFIGYGLYRGYVKKPEPTTTQKADKIVNYNYSYEPRQTFGCMGPANFPKDSFKASSSLKDLKDIKKAPEKILNNI